jgi:[acyl-carrier-protein] S-malonyltransferase
MLVFMFPGQSSRDPEMLARALAIWPAGIELVEQASRILGRDLAAQYASGQSDMFATNRDVQIGVFLTSYIYQQALAAHGITADLSLGLSLGEYNHLVHIGALTFEDALQLVEARGTAYDAGPAGMMASVFPIAADELEPYLARARAHGAVEMANLNSPTQTVIAGESPAVEAAIALIEESEPGIGVVVIERRIPMHTSLFRPIAEVLRPHLTAAPWRMPQLPYIANVDAAFRAAPGRHDLIDLLARHVYSPVLWRRAMEAVVARHPDARFVEVGPGRVLSNLMQRRWLKNPRYACDPVTGMALAETARAIANAA